MQHPSKAHLWANCALAGSLLAGRADGYVSPHAIDAEESDSRREGSAAAWLAAEWFAGRIGGPDDSPLGLVAPNGWIIDADMVMHVEAYIEYVHGYGGTVMTERPVRIGEHITGRFDNAIVSASAGVIRVFDFKYGWRIVEAEGNPELLCYGVALAKEHGAGYAVELHIYQPRPYHPEGIARKWLIEPHRVPAWEVWIDNKAMFADGMFGPPVGYPGSHCRDCSGKASCQALAATAYAAYDVVRDTRLGKMDAGQLAAELDFLEAAEEAVKHRKAGVEAEAEGRIAGGEFIAGWELATRTGHRKFSVPPAQVQLLTGIVPFKQVEMTPAEIERAGANKKTVETITFTPTIGRKLKRASVKTFERMFKK